MSQIETPFSLIDGAGIRVHHGAAAGRQHLRTAVEQTRDHAGFAAAETRLAVTRENIGNGHAGGLFDFGIGIDKGQPEPGAEAPAD